MSFSGCGLNMDVYNFEIEFHRELIQNTKESHQTKFHFLEQKNNETVVELERHSKIRLPPDTCFAHCVLFFFSFLLSK